MAARLRHVLWFAMLLSLAGCGGAEQLVSVSGTITVQGKSLREGRVIFHADAERGNTTPHEPRGSVDAQGGFELRCGDRPGAPLGWYKVVVFAMKQPKPGDGLKPPEWLADPRYSDLARSGLSVQVVENPATGAYDFDLKAAEQNPKR